MSTIIMPDKPNLPKPQGSFLASRKKTQGKARLIVECTHPFQPDGTNDFPILSATDTLTGVTTFLAGFAAADLSNFEAEDWTDTTYGNLLALVWLAMMAFTVGNTIYLSVVGILTVATHSRSRNQDRSFKRAFQEVLDQAELPEMQAAALSAVSREALTDQLQKLVRAEMSKWIAARDRRAARELRNILFAAGKSADHDAQYVHDSAFGPVVKWSDEKDCFVVSASHPSNALVWAAIFRPQTTRAIRMFPAAVACFATAQGLKALRNEDLPTQLIVGAVLAYWILPMTFISAKLVFKLTD